MGNWNVCKTTITKNGYTFLKGKKYMTSGTKRDGECKMQEIKSGIRGNAEIIFGGKIGGCTTSVKIDKPNVAIRIGELKAVLPIGVPTKKFNYEKDFQVNLVFDKIESIETFQKWLDNAKVKLQNQLEGKDW